MPRQHASWWCECPALQASRRRAAAARSCRDGAHGDDARADSTSWWPGRRRQRHGESVHAAAYWLQTCEQWRKDSYGRHRENTRHVWLDYKLVVVIFPSFFCIEAGLDDMTWNLEVEINLSELQSTENGWTKNSVTAEYIELYYMHVEHFPLGVPSSEMKLGPIHVILIDDVGKQLIINMSGTRSWGLTSG